MLYNFSFFYLLIILWPIQINLGTFWVLVPSLETTELNDFLFFCLWHIRYSALFHSDSMPAKWMLVWFLILQVAELKQELKLRGLTVSGTKNDLIERLRNYQEQNGGTAAVLKNGISQPSQQGATSAASNITSSPTTTSTPDHQLGEGGFKLALSTLAQVVPGRVMRFGSTSSSPPVSPTPSERSLAGMSPDETSCNGDMFGEMVRSICEANNLFIG